MFGARPVKPKAWVTMAGASRKRVGSVWIERRPARPPEASKAGMSSGAARTLISATMAMASSRSDQCRLLRRQLAHAAGPSVRVLLPVVDHDRRVGGGADSAEIDGVGELVDVAAVVPDVGRSLGDRATERGVGEGLHRSLGALTVGVEWLRCNRLHHRLRGQVWSIPPSASPAHRSSSSTSRAPASATRPASPGTAAGP